METCKRCSAPFEIDEQTLTLCEKMQVSEPVICPDCSHQQKMCFRNESSFYKRKCDLTGRDIISMYPPDSPHKVYHTEAWFSDKYNPLDHGRDFDFSRPFFEQYRKLMLEAPHFHMMVLNSENCEYNNFCINSRNCYLSVRVDSEDIYYSYLALNNSKDCFDCYNINACQLCYWCIDCMNCYQSKWCQDCEQCHSSSFLVNCIGCKNCFGCVGLRQKEFHIFNQPYSEQEYFEKLKEYDTASRAKVAEVQEKLQELRLSFPHKFAHIEKSEDVIGDYIFNSRHVYRCFDVEQSEDIVDCYGVEFSKDVLRSDFIYYGELCYEYLSCTKCRNIRFCYAVYESNDIEYSMMVTTGGQDCFGCFGLKHNKYCIFNKQYTKEEYFALRQRIVDHMKSTGEYGSFFPASFSPFGYNETVAALYYPLAKEEAQAHGFNWREEERETPQVEKIIPGTQLPDKLDDIPDDVLNWAIKDEISGKPFRILAKELQFYREQKIPLPTKCPEKRYEERVAMRTPRKLFERQCLKCTKEILSPYAPDRPEKVYCEKCYLETVY